MIPDRGLRIALCALLLLAPLAALSAQEMDDTMIDDRMKDDGPFYVSAAYSAALPAEPDVFNGDRITVGAGAGLLGGRIGVGYPIAGFRPEIAVGYHRASVNSLTLEKFDGDTTDAVLKPLNDKLALGGDRISGALESVDLAASVYYDIDTGTEITPYIGVAAGMSHVRLTFRENLTEHELNRTDSLWTPSFQVAAGAGYAVTEDLTLTLGYRLTGRLEAQFSEATDEKMEMTLNHNIELGLRYSFSLPF